jgi:hypothetical protein
VALRAEVYELDAGRCVGCDARLSRHGNAWAWHAHHVIKQQTMRARGLRPKWWRGPALAILLCWDCHGAQTSKMRPVPLEKLPERVHRAAAILGPWAVDMLWREHPPSDRVVA